MTWSLDIAKIAAQLKHVSLASKKLAKVDFLAWLEDRAVQVGKAALLGQWQPHWELVRKLSGERARSGVRGAVAAVRSPAGDVALTEANVARIWRQRFMEDFGQNAELSDPGRLSEFVQAWRDELPALALATALSPVE